MRPISANSRDTNMIKMLDNANHNNAPLTNFTVSEKKGGLTRSRIRKSHQQSIGDGKDIMHIAVSQLSGEEDRINTTALASVNAKTAATAAMLSNSTGGIKHSRPPSGRIKIQLDPDASRK